MTTTSCIRNRFFAIGLVLSVLVGIGCHQKADDKAPVIPVGEGEVPKKVEDAMNGANADIQAQAAQVVDAARQQDPRAIGALIQLMHRSDVSREQRTELSKCLPALLSATRKAADAGDPRAAEALKAYNISK